MIAEMVGAIFWIVLTFSIGYSRGRSSETREKVKKTPYSWSCEACLDGVGTKFEVSANSLEVLDNLILSHKSTHTRQ